MLVACGQCDYVVHSDALRNKHSFVTPQNQEVYRLAAPTTTIWDLEPHTRVKHEILKRYLQAWIPILGQGPSEDLVYIDGFAGPGRYSKGEDGSPVLALKAALDQQGQIKPNMVFMFVELRNNRADMLRLVLDEIELPPKFSVNVAGGQTFEEAVANFVDSRTKGARRLPPTFAFIDPFGWSGVLLTLFPELCLSHAVRCW